MSKIEKMVQDAQAWRKKHAAETLDFSKLDAALSGWQDGVNHVSAAQASLKAAKAKLDDAKKAVSAALKATKASRKQPKAEVKPEAKAKAKDGAQG